MQELKKIIKRPRVALFELASCAGCQLQILNCEAELLDILGLVEFVYFKEAMSETSEDYDLALIEGAVTRPADVEKLRSIREKAQLVFTLGACAHPGGIPALKNTHDMKDLERTVYGEDGRLFPSYPAQAVSEVIPVDLHVLGCPIDKDEFMQILTSVLLGKRPEVPGYPVCMECKLRENECAFERGDVCLGPVTRAGCQARCPSFGGRCFGCRGLAEDPNEAAMEGILERHGLTLDEVKAQYDLYNGGMKVEVA
jgi:coenzyme F420-reducing hydrogenase gamma subunit